MRDADWPAGAYLAEFSDAESVARAAAALEDKGYRLIETYSPYRVPEAERALGFGHSVIPRNVFFAGAIGAGLAYGIQWYVNAYSYPLRIGGRPSHAIPAFMPATFEGAILAAALVAFASFLWFLRFPQPWHPAFEIDGFERATVDRFWIAVDARDHRSDHALTPDELRALDPPPLHVFIHGVPG